MAKERQENHLVLDGGGGPNAFDDAGLLGRTGARGGIGAVRIKVLEEAAVVSADDERAGLKKEEKVKENSSERKAARARDTTWGG